MTYLCKDVVPTEESVIQLIDQVKVAHALSPEWPDDGHRQRLIDRGVRLLHLSVADGRHDMWEYRLNLSKKKTKRMIWHISELNEIYLNYYFFQKNCSYNLLYLLEAARPTLNLVNRFKMAVMPIETVRAMQKEHLVESVNFRPSLATLIKARKDLLAPSEQKIVLRLIAEDPRQVLETASKDETTQAKILDLATELLQLFLVEKSISGNEYKSRLITLLRLRSALRKKASPPTYPQGNGRHAAGSLFHCNTDK